MQSKQVIAIGAQPLPATMGVAYTTITGRGGQNERADERAHGRERGGRNRPTHRSGRSGKWRSRRSVDTGARRDPRATAATKKQRNAARHGRPERCVRSRLVLGRGFSAGPDAWFVAPGVWMAGLPVDSENPGRFDPYTRISSAPRTTCRWSLSRELVEKRRAVSPMAHLLGGGLGLADGLRALHVLPIQGRLNSVAQGRRELIRPPRNGLRRDSDSSRSTCRSAAKKFYGL